MQKLHMLSWKDMMHQNWLFENETVRTIAPFKAQLLKWIGNKQRFAHEIASYFPGDIAEYIEPFLGSGAVLGTLRPTRATASDRFAPLIEIWQTLQKKPLLLKEWYRERYAAVNATSKEDVFRKVKASFNRRPNGADLLFICRVCYGGVVRFRKADGHISTPCGIHFPMPPESFDRRVDDWHERTLHTEFICADFEETMKKAREGDLVYCDPPYTDSQAILYGAQSFSVQRLFHSISDCSRRGVRVALSIDGTKKSGDKLCNVRIPDYLFAREVYVNCGRSMLKRFQMGGRTLEREVVHDRLLLTY
jgi:DNA adenine methylase